MNSISSNIIAQFGQQLRNQQIAHEQAVKQWILSNCNEYKPYIWKKYITKDYEYDLVAYRRPKKNWIYKLITMCCFFCKELADAISEISISNQTKIDGWEIELIPDVKKEYTNDSISNLKCMHAINEQLSDVYNSNVHLSNKLSSELFNNDISFSDSNESIAKDKCENTHKKFFDVYDVQTSSINNSSNKLEVINNCVRTTEYQTASKTLQSNTIISHFDNDKKITNNVTTKNLKCCEERINRRHKYSIQIVENEKNDRNTKIIAKPISSYTSILRQPSNSITAYSDSCVYDKNNINTIFPALHKKNKSRNFICKQYSISNYNVNSGIMKPDYKNDMKSINYKIYNDCSIKNKRDYQKANILTHKKLDNYGIQFQCKQNNYVAKKQIYEDQNVLFDKNKEHKIRSVFDLMYKQNYSYQGKYANKNICCAVPDVPSDIEIPNYS